MIRPTCVPYAGTTLIAICHPNGIVLAADSFTHHPDGGTANDEAKVFALADGVIAGTVGLLSTESPVPDARMSVRQALTSHYSYRCQDPQDVAASVTAVLQKEFLRIANSPSVAPTLDDSHPHTTVFVAGKGEHDLYLVHIDGRGRYVPVQDTPSVRIVFDTWKQDVYADAASSGKLLCSSRKPEVQQALLDILLRKAPCPQRYISLHRYLTIPDYDTLVTVPPQDIEDAARDAVQYTIDRDSRIGGEIIVKTLVSSTSA